MTLDCGRKPEYQRKPTRTCKLHTEGPRSAGGFEPRTLLHENFWCSKDNKRTLSAPQKEMTEVWYPDLHLTLFHGLSKNVPVWHTHTHGCCVSITSEDITLTYIHFLETYSNPNLENEWFTLWRLVFYPQKEDESPQYDCINKFMAPQCK